MMQSTIANILPVDAISAEKARARQKELTKPEGSLGELEDLSIRIAAMRGVERPRLGQGIVFTMAADHGVAAEAVSPYPAEVTAQMVYNFLAGGAAVNVLARAAGARAVLTDVGVNADFEPAPNLYLKKIRKATDNIARGPAMTRAEAQRSIEVGIEVFEAEYAKEAFDMAATGELGIANTTPSAAIAALYTGISPREMVGKGTGLDNAGVARKVATVEKALSANRPDKNDALDVLAKIGGFEIGAIAGTCLAAAARRIPVVVDGFISTAGAIIAAGLCPDAKGYMIAAHASAEGAHRAMLDYLGLRPILDLGLRLGEGTGSALAFPICVAACKILDEMATFSDAGISGKEG